MQNVLMLVLCMNDLINMHGIKQYQITGIFDLVVCYILFCV